MPSSLGTSGNKDSARKGYERKNRADERPGLVTIGGDGARKGNGQWNRLEGSAKHVSNDHPRFDADEDIEMQPRGKITGIVVAEQGIHEYGHESSTPSTSTPRPQVTVTGNKGNDSDESLLAAHGITCTQTVEVQWTTKHVREPSPVAKKGTSSWFLDE